MFGRRSAGGAVGAVDVGTPAGRAGGGDGFACSACTGAAGDLAGELAPLAVPAAWLLAGSGLAPIGFATCEACVAGWTGLLPCVGLPCVTGAAVFFATVVCAALAGGFAAARREVAPCEAAAPRSDRAVPAVAFIPDTSFTSSRLATVRRLARPG